MGRKPLPAAARKQQLNVALDQNTRRLLESIAEDSQRSVADEIRQRVERTLLQDSLLRGRGRDAEAVIRNYLERMLREEEQYGQATLELGWDIMELAHDVRFSDQVGWSMHSMVHAALVEAVTTWLNAIKPSPDEDDKSVTEQMKQQDYNPQTLGRTVAQLRIRNRGFGSHQERQAQSRYYRMRDEQRDEGKRSPKKR
jgi:hypothetical protein